MREIFLERNDKNKRGFYMYELEVFDTFDAAHRVVGYPGKCDRLHGHTWKVAVHVAGTELDSIGMLVDFKKLKEILKGKWSAYSSMFKAMRKLSPEQQTVLKDAVKKIAKSGKNAIMPDKEKPPAITMKNAET